MLIHVNDGIMLIHNSTTKGLLLLLGGAVLLVAGCIWLRYAWRQGGGFKILRAFLVPVVGLVLLVGGTGYLSYELEISPKQVAIHSFHWWNNELAWDQMRSIEYVHRIHRDLRGRKRETERIDIAGPDDREVRIALSDFDDDVVQELGTAIARHAPAEALDMPEDEWLALLRTRPTTD